MRTDLNDKVNSIKNNILALQKELDQIINSDSNNIDRDYDIKTHIIKLASKIDNGTISEEDILNQKTLSKLNIPDSYLYHSLLAFNYYFKDKKHYNKSIKKALELNNKDTIILFNILSVKIDNEEFASEWLNKLLELITYKNLDTKVIKTLSYIYQSSDKNKRNVISNYLKKILDSKIETKLWDNYIITRKPLFDNDEYPYIVNYVKNMNYLKTILENSHAYYDLYYDLYNAVYYYNFDIYDDMLIYSFNKIESEYSSLFEIIFSQDISSDIKEEIINISKNIILSVIDKEIVVDNDDEITININEWIGVTINGDNENILTKSISQYVMTPYNEDIASIKLFNIKSIYSLVFTIIGIIVVIINSLIGGTIIAVGLLFNIYFLYGSYYNKKNIMNQAKEIKNKYLFELYNIIAEIVDIRFLVEDKLKDKELLLDFINSYEREK